VRVAALILAVIALLNVAMTFISAIPAINGFAAGWCAAMSIHYWAAA
jgi:hypothetical protein